MAPGIKKEALLVFVLLAFTYAYFFQDSGWNGNARFGLTFAVVQEGRLTIDSFHDREGTETGDKSFYNGHYYSDKAIGTSVVGAVFYLPMYRLMQLFDLDLGLQLVKYLLTFFVIGLPSALAGSLMYVLCRTISASRFRAYTVTAAIALGTMALPFSLIFFGHQLAASLLFCAFFLIFQLKASPDRWRNGSLFLIGLLLGLALITEYTTAVIVLLLVGYYFYTLWKEQPVQRRRAFVLPALGGLIPMALLLAYNTLSFGHPFSIGYEHLENQAYQESMAHGLMGIGWPQPEVVFYLTAHPAQGLFWQSPVLILSLIGTAWMFRTRQYRAEALVVVLAFLSLLLINSGYFLWWGGWSVGPRHLIPMLPFLCLPLIFIPRRLFFLVVVLGLVSVGQMVIAAASEVLIPDDIFRKIDRLRYFEYSSIYSYCYQRLLKGRFAGNLGQQLFGLEGWVSLLPLLLAVLGVTGFFAVKRASPEALSSRHHPETAHQRR